MLKRMEGLQIHREALGWFLVATIAFGWPLVWTSAWRFGVLSDVWHRTPVGTHCNATRFARLSGFGRQIETSSVVMAPMETSWQLPGVIGCKVVGVQHSNPFMPDWAQRMKATELFYAEGTGNEQRCRILSKYRVNYVLVPRERKDIAGDLPGLVRLQSADRDFDLYSVAAMPVRPATHDRKF
jgi:hypothetical protein